MDREGFVSSNAVKEANTLMLSHSKNNLTKTILEPPVIQVHNEKQGLTKLSADVSQLPFLHEYPVI